MKLGKRVLSGRRLRFVLFFSICFVMTNYVGIACSKPADEAPPSTPTVTEATYCNTVQSYADGVTVNGTAQFNIRQFVSNNTQCGLYNEVSGGAIKYAEVQFVDETGAIVQCAETTSSGTYTAVLPRNHTIGIRINSRSYNTHLNASVLDAPSSKSYYSLMGSVSTNTTGSSVTVPLLTAPATGSMTGGAFNILYNLLRANDALRYHVCGSINPPGCAQFSVAPKVSVYWKPGVNPYVYFGGDPMAGVSFYRPGTDELYILGGINGDTNSSDTDHFDDAVISHEYGHFIEDHYAKTDSPGGSHDGNHIFDARLTWGEGWANFFSSFVRNDKGYRDTYGTSDGTTGCFFNYDIDLNANTITGTTTKLDPAAGNASMATGEGNFREFAITRGLFDAVDPVPNPYGGAAAGANGTVADDNSSDASTFAFANFWSVFHGIFPNSNYHFRNVGLFLMNETADATLGASSAITFQHLANNINDYGKALPTSASGGGCPGTSIAITANDPASCSIGGQTICMRGDHNSCCSNQLASNDFYDVNYDGSNITSIFVKKTAGSGNLLVFLYKDGYTFEDSTTIAKEDITSNSTKTITLTGLSAGHYMLNVSVDTTSGTNPATINYQLYVNNSLTGQVCP